MADPYAPARWPVAVATAVLWAAAAASVVFWGLRLAAPAGTSARALVVAAAAAVPADGAAVARLLGAQPVVQLVEPPPEAASRFKLLGVAADGHGRGAALIAVDGKPARPYRAGAVLAEGHVLQSVQGREARIGAGTGGQSLLRLQLPAPPLAPNGPPLPPPALE